MRSLRLSIALLSAVLLGTASMATAKKSGKSKVAHGEIDWGEKTITVTGSAAPNMKTSANAAAARLGAERAAKMDAFRNILEAVKGVQVNGETTAGAMMDANPTLKSTIEGRVRNFSVLDTKYYSDGGVDLVVSVPMDGVISSNLLSDAGASAAKSGSAAYSGVIINAKGLKVKPALAPKLKDGKKEIYGAAFCSKDAVEKHGVVSYAKTVKEAQAMARVGAKPLMLKATSVSGDVDLVLSKADAEKLAALGPVLAQGNVVVVTD